MIKDRYITANLECSICRKPAIETEVFVEGKMLLDNNYPAYFCEKHSYGTGTKIVREPFKRYKIIVGLL